METTTAKRYLTPQFVEIRAPYAADHAAILTEEAIAFLTELQRAFNPVRKDLLYKRLERQLLIDKGVLPRFHPESENIRTSEWTVAPIPEEIQDRRVEITGPVDRKMVINALNSGAKVFMADFEDANSPTWSNNLEGQQNLLDANKRNIAYVNPTNGKYYELNQNPAVLFVRPRGWHLHEKQMRVDGDYMSASLFDFGLYLFHNHSVLKNRGSAPYFYLPKIENKYEARLWNDVFVFAQNYLGIPQGTIKATVLVETIMASFELNEILFELKQHSAGLNCGRWDYIFSYIKRLKNVPGHILPDRAQVSMEVPFMRAYSELVIQTCHKRACHAMGGMAAQIPIKGDEAANKAALEKVRQDKIREAKAGHDGTWVAHPALVPLAQDVFDTLMPTANQIHRKRTDVNVSAADLIENPVGIITEAGVRQNINVCILYLESWLRGKGAAAIYNLMEDAATAEISRTQLWQWVREGCTTDEGQTITRAWIAELLPQELAKIKQYVGEANYHAGKFDEAVNLFNLLVNEKDLIEFLTLTAYRRIN